MPKKHNYNYTVEKVSPTKQAANDYVAEGKKKLMVFATGNIDVTKPREYFRTHRDEEGNKYSFTAYMAYLLGQAVLEHPYINAYMSGRKKLVIFEDVDIVCIVERHYKDHIRPIPTSYTIRSAQKKHWKEIHNEIRDAQKRKSEGLQYDKKGKKQSSRVKWVTKMPGWLRRLIISRMMKNPHQKKRFMGTIGLSSVGSFLKEAGTAIAMTPNTLSFQVGGTDWQPRFIDGELQNREILSASFAVDHAVIDGGDGCRFVETFRQMFTAGHGIDFTEPPNAPEEE